MKRVRLVVCLLSACGSAEPTQQPNEPREAPAPEPAADEASGSAGSVGTAEPAAAVYEDGECVLVLGPDRRFPPRAGLSDDGPGLSHLPAGSANGDRFLVRVVEPYMDEGDYEPQPLEVQVRQVSDGAIVERILLASAEEREGDDPDSVDARARAAQSAIREHGYLSLRRLRGPVRASLLDGVLQRLDELEGPCRAAWEIPAAATFEAQMLGGVPGEDERCFNEVHDVDLHVDIEHRFGLVVVDVGTHADLCASGAATYLFRWR